MFPELLNLSRKKRHSLLIAAVASVALMSGGCQKNTRAYIQPLEQHFTDGAWCRLLENLPHPEARSYDIEHCLSFESDPEETKLAIIYSYNPKPQKFEIKSLKCQGYDCTMKDGLGREIVFHFSDTYTFKIAKSWRPVADPNEDPGQRGQLRLGDTYRGLQWRYRPGTYRPEPFD